jgi:hypothetical protein
MRKAIATEPSEEFKRFREITRCILAVPKREIDQQKAKYDQKRKQAKTKKPVK